jgi:hypothetical protein
MGNCRCCKAPDARRTTVHRCASGRLGADVCKECAIKFNIILTKPTWYNQDIPKVFVLDEEGKEVTGWLTSEDCSVEAAWQEEWLGDGNPHSLRETKYANIKWAQEKREKKHNLRGAGAAAGAGAESSPAAAEAGEEGAAAAVHPRCCHLYFI